MNRSLTSKVLVVLTAINAVALVVAWVVNGRPPGQAVVPLVLGVLAILLLRRPEEPPQPGQRPTTATVLLGVLVLLGFAALGVLLVVRGDAVGLVLGVGLILVSVILLGFVAVAARRVQTPGWEGAVEQARDRPEGRSQGGGDATGPE